MQQRRTGALDHKYEELRTEEKRTHAKKKKLYEQVMLEHLEAQRR